jgi:hypothetical protein
VENVEQENVDSHVLLPMFFVFEEELKSIPATKNLEIFTNEGIELE